MKLNLQKTIYMLSKYFLYGFMIQLFILNVVLATNVKGQYKSIDEVQVKVKNKSTTLIEIFELIESQTSFTFLYDHNQINEHSKLSLSRKQGTVESFLQEIGTQVNLSFRQVNNGIDTKPRKGGTVRGDEILAPLELIRGTVMDETGAPMPGVAIQEMGTTNGTITDIDGNYSLNVNQGATLVFSFLGYEKQAVTIDNQTVLDITMVPDEQSLEEVVVIGYGEMKKSDLTGAISQVKAEDLPISGKTSVEQMLSGKAAGVQIRGNDAQPGGGISVLIRGAASTGAGNEPLYIIDGFPVSGGVDPGTGSRYSKGARSPLNSLNPNDVASIEILKDASATAIYGARAANGVILITTKSGKQGKVKVNYDFKQSVQNLSRPWDMMNAQEYMQAVNNYREEKWLADNEIGVYGDTDPSSVTPWTPAFSDAEIANAGDGTDWFGEVTQKGKIQEHNISISGANEQTNYLVSINAFDQNGVVKKNEFKRLTARLNLDQRINEWLKFGVRATGSRIDIDNPSLGTGGAENTGVITAALNFTPTLPVRLENGEYSIVPNSSFFPNPVSLLEISNNTIQDRILAQAFAELEPVKGLRIRGQLGFDKQEGVTKLYLPKTTLYGDAVNGQANISQNNRFDKLLNFTVSYKRDLWEGHSLNALIGYEYQEFSWDGFGLGNNNFTTDSFLYNNIGAGESERPTVSSYKGQDKLASYFGRLNYNMEEKYLFTFTMRADGSTKFGKGNKFGYFPSGAFAWRLINEGFMENNRVFSDLKLRLSAGQTGNSNISGAFALYGFGANYLFGGNVSTGAYLSSYANDELKWETTTEYNLGLDFGFLQNRITGSLELFSKEVDGLLGSRQLKTYLVLDRVAANLGTTTSKGYELTINSVNIEKTDFSWSSNFNISAYRDRWKKRSPDVVLSSYQSETDPIRVHWGYLTDGLVQPGEVLAHMPGAKPGALKIRDIDGYNEENELTGEPDGIINDADVVKIANADPKFIFGFSNTLAYKDFDLNFHIYGMMGIYKYNNYVGMANNINDIDRGWNFPNILGDFWSSKNQEAKYPNNNVVNSTPGSDQYLLQKADFVRVQNITLGYTVPSFGKLDKVFDTARIYFDVSNPFLFTDFTGIDPEYSGIYPVQTTFTLGANISF